MLTKILFTLLVIVGVVFFFRTKTGSNPQTPQVDGRSPVALTDATPKPGTRSLSTRTIAYGMLTILAGISVIIFVLHSNSANRIVNIRVISDAGETTHYQARHKTIKGRKFETLDGKSVTLGESDRVEMSEP